MRRNTRGILLIFLLATACSILTGCVSPQEQPRVEQAPAVPAAETPVPVTDQTKPERAAKLRAPTQADVRNAIARIYKNAVTVDASHFVVGDFNGDGSQDLAVVVRPAQGMLSEINSEVANWILEDPQKVTLPDAGKATQHLGPSSKPPRVEDSDILLAVLHGFGPSGWRDPNSRQTYLLKNAVGTNLKSRQLADVLNSTSSKTILPKLRGDVINENIGDESGFLFYTGAKYAWYRSAATAKSVATR
jgi:hypothetical protein